MGKGGVRIGVTWGEVDDKLKQATQKIPKAYLLLKWLYLIMIAVGTALVGFLQSMIVSWLYELRWSQAYANVGNQTRSYARQAIQYIGLNLVLAFGCTMSLFVISPAAAGSGIPDVKAFLNGVESPIWVNFFTIKTFIAKVIGSALAVSSGLVMGKEGPMLHAGSILAVVLGSSKWMTQKMEQSAHWGLYTYNKDLRDLVAIGAACGVTTAFKAPVGGVLFAMELSTRWRKELTWRCFLAAAITIVSVRLCVTMCVFYQDCGKLKWGSLIWFTPTYPNPYPYWHLPFVIVLAVIGGYLGCLFTSFNTWVCVVRKKWAKVMWARVLEVCCISVATSLVFFILPMAGACKACDASTSSSSLSCLSGGGEFHIYSGYFCHKPNHYNDLAVLVFNPQGLVTEALFTAHSKVFSFQALAVYALFYWAFAAITSGSFIASGIFTPSLIFGGCLGRIFAELLVLMHIVPVTDDGVSHVGMYALLGAAAFLGGLMRMSAAMALILMEMTQSPIQMPFLMLTLVVAKNVGDHFNHSVFDQQMMLKGLAFVGVENENMQKKLRLDASDVMAPNDRKTTLFPQESGATLAAILETQKDAQAFAVTRQPAVEGGKGNFMGMISRKNVSDLVEAHGAECEKVDLLPLVEIAPIIVPPNMPLPFVYRIFNSEGFNYVPVVREHGPLEGLVSREDLVKIQNSKLDSFQLQAQLEKMDKQVEEGHIIGSMQLQDNVHAKAFKGFLYHPLQKTQEFLAEDDKPSEEQSVFFSASPSLGVTDQGVPLLSASQRLTSGEIGSSAREGPNKFSSVDTDSGRDSSDSAAGPSGSRGARGRVPEGVPPGGAAVGTAIVSGRGDVGAGEHYGVGNALNLSKTNERAEWLEADVGRGVLGGGGNGNGDHGAGEGPEGGMADIELGDNKRQ